MNEVQPQLRGSSTNCFPTLLPGLRRAPSRRASIGQRPPARMLQRSSAQSRSIRPLVPVCGLGSLLRRIESERLRARPGSHGMRDTLLIGIVGVLALVALVRPWVGVMGWTLISIMNPHRYSWAASKLPVAAVIAIATLIGLLITRDRRASPFTAPTIVLLAFMAWISLTFPFSFSVDQSFAMWDRVMKIDLMIIVATVALTRRTHVMALAWVLVCSIGLFGFKGGIFTLLHGGVYRVWGPPD